MHVWKVLGLAGLAGVAAAGVIITREQRQRTQLGPEQIRARLHERLQQAPTAPTSGAVAKAPVASPAHRWFRPRAGMPPSAVLPGWAKHRMHGHTTDLRADQ